MMHKHKFSAVKSKFCLLVLAVLCSNAWADVPGDLKALIEQGRFAEAFDLGMRNQRLAGDPQYDYFFGVAAIDSGRAVLGVLALERVLLDNPGNDLARLELARGYFVIKDYERAREEFQYMLGRELPATVRSSVNRYLSAIRETDPQFRTVRRTFFEYAVGHNSNVNSATSASTIDIPSIGPITLGGSSKPSPSALTQLSVGTQIQGPLTVDTKYSVGVEANYRGYAQRDTFDQGSLTALGGLDFDLKGSNLKTSGYFSRVMLNYARFRDTTGLVLDWNRPLSKETQIRTSFGYSQLRYGESNVARDADLLSLSAGMNRFLGTPWRVSLDLDVNLAEEQNIRGRGDFQRTIFGVRSGISFHPGGRWSGSAGAGYSWSNYKDVNPLMQELRRDGLLMLDLGLQHQLTPGWAARADLSVSKNQSNLELYSYNSMLLMLKMRYEWK